MTEYSKPGAMRFTYAGMCTSCPPDIMPPGKVPLAVNVHAFLEGAVTPRLPQSSPLVSTVPASTIHSLRRMNDNTSSVYTTAYGPDSPSTGTDVSVPGGAAWANPGNITAPDGAYASVTLSPGGGNFNVTGGGTTGSQTNITGKQSWVNPGSFPTSVSAKGVIFKGQLTYTLVSQTLFRTGYGFSLPATATVLGIAVTINRFASLAVTVHDTTVQLLKAGTVTGSNQAGGFWPTSAGLANYGSSSFLWGTTWTPGDINNANFGVALSCNGNSSSFFAATVNAITVTVYYSVPTGAGTSDLLEATNFGFSVPGGATISSIFVEVLGYRSGTGTFTFSAQLLKGGVLSGNIANMTGPPTGPPAAYFSSSGSGTLWGTTFAPADINAANFGVALQANVSTGSASFFIDYVRITVFAFTSSPVTGYVLISGSADKVFVGASQVASGMSQNRLALVPFRPNNSVRPWMYVGDSNKMLKISSDSTVYKQGIKEPQVVPSLATAGAGPLTGSISYAYSYRSSVTGAQSNLSPIGAGNSITAASNNITVTCTASTDPQADLIDVWRFDAGLLAYTYVGTIPNSSPTFTDSLSDAIVSANQQATFDNFEPYPSIDIPRSGTLTVSAGPYAGTVTCTQASGSTFNVNWLPGTIVTIGSGAGSTLVTLFARPTSTTVFVGLIQPPGATLANGTYTFSISQPQLAAQPMPALWGPTDNAAYMFACGDTLNPGTLYFSKGNQPDSAPQTNTLLITSPSEPLIGGAIVGGLSIVMSTERGWLIYPNFAQATASAIGVSGSPFTTVPTIPERGLWCKEGICTDGGANLFFICKDGIRKSAGGTGSQSITDDDLFNLFPHEGQPQIPYTIGGYTISPPNYSNPNGMALRFGQGYVYFDYIGLDGTYHTLKYHVARAAWSVEIYATVASIHADNEGQGTVGSPPLIAIGPLTGCTDGTIRQLTSTATETSSQCVVLTPSIGGVTRSVKHYGDIYIEHSVPASATAFSMALWSDRYRTALSGVLTSAILPTPTTNREGFNIDLNGGQGIFVKDLAIAFSAPIAAPGIAQDGVTQEYLALFLWEPSLIEQPDTTSQRFTDWEDGGTNRAKFLQGVIIHADSSNVPKTIQVQSGDDLSYNSLNEVGTGIAFAVEQNIAFSLASPFVTHRMRLVLDTVPWRLWDLEWIFTVYPELAEQWTTPFTAHGMQGWQHVKEINVQYAATSPVTLTITTDTGFIGANLVIPATAGSPLKSLVTIPPFKGKMFQYAFNSPSPFMLWREDLEVRCGEWGRQDSYKEVKPFGGPSTTEAQV